MFKRLITIIKGLLLGLLGKAEAINPKALLEVEEEKLRDTIQKFNDQIASHKGKVIQAEGKLDTLKKSAAGLDSKIKTFIKMKKMDLAGGCVSKLKIVNKSIVDLEEFIETADDIYENLLAERKFGVETARTNLYEIGKSIDEAELHESMAEIKEMSAGFTDQLSNSGLSRLKEQVEETAALAKGRVEVATDLAESEDLTTSREFCEAQASNDLAAYMAEQGIEAPTPVTTPVETLVESLTVPTAPVSTMGPDTSSDSSYSRSDTSTD
jgi:phage shock protein A